MSDETITCRDCSTTFVFTEGERAYFDDKGFKPPRRCKACRAAKKAREAGELPAPTTVEAQAPVVEPRRPAGPRKGGRRDDRDERQ